MALPRVLTPHQLQRARAAAPRPDFAQVAIATAARHRVELSSLTAEVTETSPVSLDEVLPTLTLLRKAGLGLSLDDFGTGYSSLARLRVMPFSVLKTDRSFMSGIPGEMMARELLRGIITLGTTLGLDVIVEGVETAEQERAVLGLGARLAQGYHLGAPVPAAEIERRVLDMDEGARDAARAVSLAAGRIRSSLGARRTPPPLR